MKFAVSTYSFSQLLGSGALNQFTCIAKAKELGFDGVEFVDLLPHDGSSPEEYARRLREECERQGLFVANFTFGADFLSGSNGDTAAEVERVKRQIDLAVLLGAVSVRHDATTGFAPGTRGARGFDDALPVLADACREVTRYAAGKGVRTMVENHGFFCQDSRRVEKLVNRVADDNFRLLCDMGNFLCADEDPALAVSRVAPYAGYVHAKDFLRKLGTEPDPGRGFFRTRAGNYLRGTVVGHGVVPVPQCLYALKREGYDGNVCIEFEGPEEALSALQTGLENLKRYAE